MGFFGLFEKKEKSMQKVRIISEETYRLKVILEGYRKENNQDKIKEIALAIAELYSSLNFTESTDAEDYYSIAHREDLIYKMYIRVSKVYRKERKKYYDINKDISLTLAMYRPLAALQKRLKKTEDKSEQEKIQNMIEKQFELFKIIQRKIEKINSKK